MISLGFSPCPNDTFIFYALANKIIDQRGLDFRIIIEDVETLNQLAMRRSVDVTKISCHAYYYLQKDYHFLTTGGAFGRKCGPLLVVRGQESGLRAEIKKIAIPGELTTAFLLLKLYLNSKSNNSHFSLSASQFIPMPFHKIPEAVRDGQVDAGLIIHESRFTYQEYGLSKIIDLGDWWEDETGLPLPLGGIIAKRSIGAQNISMIESLIRESLEYSMRNREEVIPFIKMYAQELSDDVIFKHIALYVNNYTIDIGKDGKTALDELIKRAIRLGI